MPDIKLTRTDEIFELQIGYKDMIGMVTECMVSAAAKKYVQSLKDR